MLLSMPTTRVDPPRVDVLVRHGLVAPVGGCDTRIRIERGRALIAWRSALSVGDDGLDAASGSEVRVGTCSCEVGPDSTTE